jgi:type-2 restriction enzyme nspV
MLNLDIQTFVKEAHTFSQVESNHAEPALFGVTDGKAVGTYLEHKFKNYLDQNYSFQLGNSANGIDFPSLNTDMKVTSKRQPQSSCPYKSARQKIFGLGYNLIVFVYEKYDDSISRTGRLNITDTIFVEASRTADFQTTTGILEILRKNGNRDDLIGFMIERNLPVEEIELNNIANEILITPPNQGFLTISNALQWRLQYTRVIEMAGQVQGIHSIFKFS